MYSLEDHILCKKRNQQNQCIIMINHNLKNYDKNRLIDSLLRTAEHQCVEDLPLVSFGPITA